MNSIFSVDDISELLWQGPIPSPAMSRSPSEWELEKFLEDFPVSAAAVASSSASGYSDSRPSAFSHSKPQNVDDDVVVIEKPEVALVPHSNLLHQPSDRVSLASPDSDDYRSFLKSQLDLACAAAAKARESSVKPEANSSLVEDQRIATKSHQLESQISGNGLSIPEITKSPSEVNCGSPSVPALPSVQKKQEAQVRQTTSVSSREDSDDDELDGDTETNELGPSDEKRARRMLSNRESARRSRRRKQAQLNELETQVGQLRDERTTLLTRLTDINKKCDDASVDNRILNANIETLRTKVKMAEDQVKRVTGLNPLLLARSNMANTGMQFRDAPANVALPMQPNNSHYFHHSVPNIAAGAPHRQIQRLNEDQLTSAANPQAGNGTTTTVVEIPRVQNLQKPAAAAVNQARELPPRGNVANQPVKISRKSDL